MTKIIAISVVICVLLLSGCANDAGTSSAVEAPTESDTSSSIPDSGNESSTAGTAENEPTEVDEMKIVINGAEFTAKFGDTKAAEEFKKMLPLTLEMSELNGNEKYFYLDKSLSANSENIGHIESGDIMLYGSSCIVLFYESFNTFYAYTRIGHIEDPEGLKSAVGSGSVTVEFK